MKTAFLFSILFVSLSAQGTEISVNQDDGMAALLWNMANQVCLSGYASSPQYSPAAEFAKSAENKKFTVTSRTESLPQGVAGAKYPLKKVALTFESATKLLTVESLYRLSDLADVSPTSGQCSVTDK